jgi:hypothetical protein
MHNHVVVKLRNRDHTHIWYADAPAWASVHRAMVHLTNASDFWLIRRTCFTSLDMPRVYHLLTEFQYAIRLRLHNNRHVTCSG